MSSTRSFPWAGLRRSIARILCSGRGATSTSCPCTVPSILRRTLPALARLSSGWATGSNQRVCSAPDQWLVAKLSRSSSANIIKCIGIPARAKYSPPMQFPRTGAERAQRQFVSVRSAIWVHPIWIKKFRHLAEVRAALNKVRLDPDSRFSGVQISCRAGRP